jgi:hypothetical protein
LRTLATISLTKVCLPDLSLWLGCVALSLSIAWRRIVIMKSFVAALMAFSAIGVTPLALSTSAEAGWGHRHYGHHHRGETCWRTNRHTGAHFRIC